MSARARSTRKVIIKPHRNGVFPTEHVGRLVLSGLRALSGFFHPLALHAGVIGRLPNMGAAHAARHVGIKSGFAEQASCFSGPSLREGFH